MKNSSHEIYKFNTIVVLPTHLLREVLIDKILLLLLQTRTSDILGPAFIYH